MRCAVVLAVLVAASMTPAYAGETDAVVIETLMMEAANQGATGMQAVGEVIRTRAKQRNLTPEQVCLQKWQFSCWNDRKWAANWLRAHAKADLRQSAIEAWKRSASSNLTHGANHYYAPSLCKQPKYAIGKAFIDIKDHRFFNA